MAVHHDVAAPEERELLRRWHLGSQERGRLRQQAGGDVAILEDGGA